MGEGEEWIVVMEKEDDIKKGHRGCKSRLCSGVVLEFAVKIAAF